MSIFICNLMFIIAKMMNRLIKKIKELTNKICIHDWHLYNIWENAGYEYKGDTVMVERMYKICNKCGKTVYI